MRLVALMRDGLNWCKVLVLSFIFFFFHLLWVMLWQSSQAHLATIERARKLSGEIKKGEKFIFNVGWVVIMSSENHFTVYDVREIQNRFANKPISTHDITSADREFDPRSHHFTSEEINSAFAAAKKSMEAI